MWIALRGDRPVARAAWWARAGDARPQLMSDLAGYVTFERQIDMRWRVNRLGDA
jgi:hypothetical protein